MIADAAALQAAYREKRRKWQLAIGHPYPEDIDGLLPAPTEGEPQPDTLTSSQENT